MSPSPESDAPVAPSVRERCRKCLPGSVVFIGLLGIAKLAQIADRHAWWARGQYELLSVIVFASTTAAMCVGLLTLHRLSHSKLKPNLLRRILSTFCFAAIGLKVGGRYIHMCMAGSRLIEGLAMFGTPILAGAVVSSCKRLFVGYSLAICLLAIIWLVARTYLDWVHGN